MSDKPDFDTVRQDFHCIREEDESNKSDSSKKSNESAVAENKIDDAELFEISEKPQKTENESNKTMSPEFDSLKQEFDEFKKFIHDKLSEKSEKIQEEPKECQKLISGDDDQDKIAILSRKLIEKLVWETTPSDIVSKISKIFKTTGQKENFLRNSFELVIEREAIYRICFVNLLKTLIDDEVINSDNILNAFFAIVIPKPYNENPKIWENSIEIFYPLVKLGYVKLKNIIRKATHEINCDYLKNLENFIEKIQEIDDCDKKISSGEGSTVFQLKESCECLLEDLSINNEVTNSCSLQINKILDRKPKWIFVNKILSLIFYGKSHQRTSAIILIKYLITDRKIITEKTFVECLVRFFHMFKLLDDDRFEKQIKIFYTEFINPLLIELKSSCQYFKTMAVKILPDENSQVLCQILGLDLDTKYEKSLKKCEKNQIEKNSAEKKNATSNEKSKLDGLKNVKAPETKIQIQKRPSEPETMPYISLNSKIQTIIENLMTTDDIKQSAEQIARNFNKIQLDSVIRVIMSYGKNKSKKYRLKSGYVIAELCSIYEDQDADVHNRVINSLSLALGEIDDTPEFWQKIAEFLAPLMLKKKVTFADWLRFPRYILTKKEYCQQLLLAVLNTIKMETNMATINELWQDCNVSIDQFIPSEEVYKFLSDNNLDFCISNEELLYYKQKCSE